MLILQISVTSWLNMLFLQLMYFETPISFSTIFNGALYASVVYGEKKKFL